MACGGQTKNITYTSNALSTRFQRRPAWYKLSPRSISTFLSNSYRVHGKHNVLHIQRSDKIIILFRFNNTFTIYRKRDEAVAVLKNVTFKQPDPPVVFEISQLAESIDGIHMVLMYAVALKDWTHDTEIKFNEGDLVLILADIGQEEYVGITEQKQVGVFPSAIVRIITNPRRLLMDGVKIRMECAYLKDSVELHKAHGRLFTWQTKDGVVVSLKEYNESGFQQMSVRYINYGGFGNYDEVSYEGLPFVEKYSYPDKPLPLPPLQASRPPTDTTESNESQSETTKMITQPKSPFPRVEENDERSENVEQMYSSPIPPSRAPSVTTEGNVSQSEVKQKILSDDMNDEYMALDFTDKSYQGDSQGDHWFKRRMSRCSAEQLLTNEGDYLFRYKDDGSNAIVLSQCTGENQFRHSIVMPESPYEILGGTSEVVEERILQFARSERLLFEDDKPIRLGGTREQEKVYYDFATISSETKPSFKIEEFENDEAGTSGGDVYYSEIPQENEYHEYRDALTFLLEKGCMVVPKDLHENVADHLIDEKWDEFGKHLKVPANTRRLIQGNISDPVKRTTKLLDVWHERKGEDATVKELVDALLKLNLEEITGLLEDLRDNLKIEDSS